MHMRVRAPLLSAAFNIVRIWIMVLLPWPSLARGLVHDRKQAPGLVPGERPTRRDGHGVAFMGLALLIVREELRRAADVLAVLRVLDEALNLNRNRLLHLGADDAPGEGARLLLGGRVGGGIGRHVFSPAGRLLASRMIVFSRAML